MKSVHSQMVSDGPPNDNNIRMHNDNIVRFVHLLNEHMQEYAEPLPDLPNIMTFLIEFKKRLGSMEWVRRRMITTRKVYMINSDSSNNRQWQRAESIVNAALANITPQDTVMRLNSDQSIDRIYGW
jgi:hypothetical protein